MPGTHTVSICEKCRTELVPDGPMGTSLACVPCLRDRLGRAERRVSVLERVIVMARRSFRSRKDDPIEPRAWLFRVEIDEESYPS